MKNVSKVLLILSIAGGCLSPAWSQGGLKVKTVEGGHAAEGSPASARELLKSFFEAFNSGDGDRMQAFYRESATEAFRSRRSEQEDRELYERLFGDMGPLEVQRMTRKSEGEARVTARSANMPDPIELVFTLVDGRIDGFSVRIGGPPEEASTSLSLNLPHGGRDLELARVLDEQLVQLDLEGVFSGVVLLARNGRPFFHRAYGMADRDKTRRNRTTTRFDIGSITVEQLLEHRSGLGDIFNDRWEEAPKDELIRPGDFFSLFADRPLQFEPGSGRAYSNAGYIVLANLDPPIAMNLAAQINRALSPRE